VVGVTSRSMARLSTTYTVPFSCCGSLMLSFL
jgi:hypothetical protein